MKLCFIANPNNADVRRWAEHFSGQGDQVFFIGEHTPLKRIPDEIEFIDLTHRINIHKLRYVIWGLVIRKYLKEIQPDILHTFGIASAGWLGLFSRYHPWIVTVTGTDLLHLNQRSWLHQCLSISALKKADYVLCVSDQLQQMVMELGVNNKVGISIFGVNTNIFHSIQDRSAVRQKLGLENLPTIISLRAMQSLYNPITIARAIPSVLEKVQKVQFLIFTYHSDPELLAQFKSIVQKHNADCAVHYIDDLSDDQSIAEYLQASDIAISIPSTDGTPSSVLECMACGTPVIISDLPSLHNWVQPDIHGLYVPAGNVQALSDAILRLVSDKDLRAQMSAKVLETIKEKADQQKSTNNLENLYRQVLEKERDAQLHHEF